MHVGKWTLGLALMLSSCGSDAEVPPKIPADIQYELTPIFPKIEPNRLKVVLKFKGEADGDTQLRIGGRWANVEYSNERFRKLTVAGDGVVLPDDIYQRDLDVEHTPGADITVTYELSAEDMRDAASDIEYFYTPVLNDDLIHIIGTHGLARPYRGDLESKFSISFDWKNLPPDWAIIDTLPDEKIYAGHIATQVLAAAPSDNIVEDGGLSILKSGQHDFSPEEFNTRIKVIFKQINELWQTETPDYHVSLLGTPPRKEHNSFTGTGRYNSFVAAATPGMDLEFLTVFLAHEINHHWITGELGDRPRCTDDEEKCPPSIFWFSEGFTDFVAAQVMIDGGYWDRKDLVKFTNQYLRDYHMSPARNATGKAIDELFWQDFEHERQPYWRGFLIAMNWEAETQYFTKGSVSVMSVLQDMHAHAEQSGEDRPVLTADYIAKQFSHKRHRIEDIERYYIKGETLQIRPNLFPDCATLTEAPVYGYDVGFDPEATLSTGIVSGVSADHNAAKAGLKNGQQFLAKVSGGGGDTTVPLVLEVQDGEATKTISYMPIGGEPVMVPQFEITGPCTNDYFYWE